MALDLTAEELARVAALMGDTERISLKLKDSIALLNTEIEKGHEIYKNRHDLLQAEVQLQEQLLQKAQAELEFVKQDITARTGSVDILEKQNVALLRTIESQKLEKVAIQDNIDLYEMAVGAGGLQPTELRQLEQLRQSRESITKQLEDNTKKIKSNNEAITIGNNLITAQGTLGDEQIKRDKEKILLDKQRDVSITSLSNSLKGQFQANAGLTEQYNHLSVSLIGNGGAMGFLAGVAKSATGAFTALLNPVTLLGSAFFYASSNFQRFYDTMAKLGRELGTTVTAGFNSAAAAGNRLGIDAGTQAATVNSLAGAYINLGNKQREQTTELLIASYEMQKFGIGASESVTLLSAFDRSLGYSTKSSVEMSTALVHTARNLGLTSEAVKGLATNMGSFVVYGSQANEVMKDTLQVSSKFGIGADAIAKFGDKLDSLDASLTLSRTLARDFGVAIDHIALMRANPAEKMEMLAKAMQNVNIHTDAGRFRIRNLADSMGMTAQQTMLLMNQIENGSDKMSDMEKYIRDIDVAFQDFTGGQTLDGLAQIKVFIENISKPLMLIFGAINAVVGALFGAFNFIIEKMNKIGTFFGVGLGDLTGTIVVLTLVIFKFGSIVGGVASTIGGAFASALGLATGGLSTMIAGLSSAATAAAGGILPLIGFGFAILLIGGGIALAALGMAEFVKAFKGFSGSEIFAIAVAMIAFAIAVTILINAIAMSAGGAAVALIVLAGLSAAFLIMAMAFTNIATAIKDIAGVDIKAPVLHIKAIYEAIGEPTVASAKVKPVVQLSEAMKNYGEAIAVFSQGGGSTASQAMATAMSQAITTVINNTQTSSNTNVAGGGGISGGTVQLYLGDELVVTAALKKMVNVPAAAPK
jgi:hypothetical protein